MNLPEPGDPPPPEPVAGWAGVRVDEVGGAGEGRARASLAGPRAGAPATPGATTPAPGAAPAAGVPAGDEGGASAAAIFALANAAAGAAVGSAVAPLVSPAAGTRAQSDVWPVPPVVLMAGSVLYRRPATGPLVAVASVPGAERLADRNARTPALRFSVAVEVTDVLTGSSPPPRSSGSEMPVPAGAPAVCRSPRPPDAPRSHGRSRS